MSLESENPEMAWTGRDQKFIIRGTSGYVIPGINIRTIKNGFSTLC